MSPGNEFIDVLVKDNLKASSTQPSGLSSDDHPGGPLSRAERVLLSQLKRSAMQSRTLIYGMIHVLGAIPGAQKIEAAHKEAVTALDRFCLAMITRKQGAPFPDGPQAREQSEPLKAVDSAPPSDSKG